MKKGIVLGAGWIGTRIADYMGYDLRKFNGLNQPYLKKFLDKEKPDVIVNAIVKSNLDWCESNVPDAVLSNIAVPLIIGAECRKRGILMVHFGTGSMYEENNNGYGFREEDEPNFFGRQVYADTKSQAEDLLFDFMNENTLQFRIHLPIDSIPHEKNLIDKLKKFPKVANDNHNSVTSIPNALPVIRYIINKGSTGIYNLVNPGVISSGNIMAYYKGIVDPNHHFETASFEEINKTAKAKRAKRCKLNMDKLKMELRGSNLWIPDIHDAVKECLMEYKRNLGK